jgi:ornithine carbamoyltransferase
VKADYLTLADWSPDQVQSLLARASELKAAWKRGERSAPLADRTLGMIFQKPSLRTRVSFEVGMQQLGGHALYLSPDEIKLGQRESIPDVARVLSRYVDGIMARVFAHSDVETLARYASVPVINGLSDYCHPCQGLTDLLTIQEKLGSLRGARLLYVGDGNNVLHSLLFGAALTGMDLVYATPQGYDPEPAVVSRAQALARDTGANILCQRDPLQAAEGADVIYTDTWTSMGQESESAKRRLVFPPYQVNVALLERAKPSVGVMHCLPAHRGEEITDEVADGPHSWVFDQAENRLHAQKAILLALMEG